MTDDRTTAGNGRAVLIRPPNKIKDKVTMGGQIKGDGFDPALLKQAEERAEALRDVFLEAAEADLDRLVAAFHEADSAPDDETRADALAIVEKVAHEMKGYGANIGYDLITRFADSLSLFLRKAEVSDDARMDVTRVHVDALRLVLRGQITGDGGAEGAELTRGLRDAVAKYLRPDQF